MSDTLSPTPILEPAFKKPRLIEDNTQNSSPKSIEKKDVPKVVTREVAIERAKKRNRCLVCNKKLGLLPFDCKCGAVTCTTHRGLGHECTFDFRAEAQERLRKANPVIAAEKLNRI